MPKRLIQIFIGHRRQTIRFGRVADPATFATHVRHLANAMRYDLPIKGATARWLAALHDSDYAKLSRVGLVTPRRQSAITTTAIGPYIDEYIKRRTDVALSTAASLKQARTSATDFFGENRDMATITRGEARDWHRQVTKAPATLAMYVKKLRQVFDDAIDRKLITDNPFKAVKAGSMANAERQVYIPAADIEKVIDVCPTNEWKMLFAAARYQGMRIPSETTALEWGDIFWHQNRMRVRSSKTKHHEGKATRIVPIFPEFMRFLLQAFSADDRDPKYVFGTIRGENLRTQADRIIAGSEVSPWVKPFQNLRSSCETDLTSRFPLHVACAWIGNSTGVALKHYLQVTDAHFDLATKSAAPGAEEVAGNDRKSGGANSKNPSEIPVNLESSLLPEGIEQVAVSGDLLQGAHQALQSALKKLNLNGIRDELIGGLGNAVRSAKRGAR